MSFEVSSADGELVKLNLGTIGGSPGIMNSFTYLPPAQKFFDVTSVAHRIHQGN